MPTKYTIATAIVIDALLDWAQTKPQEVRDKVIALCARACEPYCNAGILSPSGLMPYSLEFPDRQYDTFNPAAYMAGICQQVSMLIIDPELAGNLRRVADRTMRVLLDNRQIASTGTWFWHYSITEHVPNDLAHACYIMEGILRYARFGGSLAAEFDLNAVTQHLFDYMDKNSGTLRKKLSAFPLSVRKDFFPPRAYDLGMAINFCFKHLNEKQRLAVGVPLLSLIDNYHTQGHMSRYPLYHEKPVFVREYETYIMLGLARFLWRTEK